ncbi:MAG: insulinase family protein [Candidatus Latescibacterota bacterium]
MAQHDFRLLRAELIPELNTQVSYYRHRTGAQLLSLTNDDENKAFGITFRTPVWDSTGVAHILEHAVLCGSRKYPVKEPFVELVKGSLNTFLNALTYPDRTCYPVASQNLQDFYNLVDVYLDAVFYPRLTPHVLQQEGWHYEVDSVEEPLSLRGVVYNEMKGAYSDPERMMAEHAQQSLFPDTTYAHESGGHPRHIPDLTFEQFRAFHQQHYHPANARVWFYGDDDPERRLALLEEYLGDFDARTVDSRIPLQPPLAAPRRLLYHFPASPERERANRTMVTINWLLPDGIEQEERRALQILEHALLGTAGSPLRKALIESGLGEDLTGSGGEAELVQIYFGTGLKGVAPENAEKVPELVVSTLERLVREGLDPDAVAAAVNTVEFRLRENNTGSFPRGLALMMRALTAWNYDRDPFAALAFAGPLGRAKDQLAAAPRLLESLIQRHLLDNPHRTIVVLQPDPQLQERQDAEERERLAGVRATMSPAQRQETVEAARQLRLRQATPDPPEALATVPRLQLGDLERQVRALPLEVASPAAPLILYHDLFTNGIAYVELGFDLRALPPEHLPFVPLLGRALLEMGTQQEDYVRLGQRIGARTGGLWAQTLLAPRRGQGQAAAWFLLRGKAMVDRVGDLLAIARDVLLAPRLDDRERFRQLLLEEKAGEESGLIPGGHRVVSLRLRAQFDEAGWLQEQTQGLTYLLFVRELVKAVESDWPAVCRRLQEVRQLLVNRRAMLVNATLTAADRPAFEAQLAAFLQQLPEADWQPVVWHRQPRRVDEGLIVPAQVNYVGKAANLYQLGYTLSGSTCVVTRYLGNTFLWDRVRVQGGAYGAFCSFDPFSGVLGYTSYRDPNLLDTLAVYDQSARFLRELALGEDELAKAIIGTIGDMDPYRLPDAKGFTSMVRYLTQSTDEFRQLFRDQVLGTRPEDFRALADVLAQVAEEGRVAVLGGQEAVESADRARGGWLEKQRVL